MPCTWWKKITLKAGPTTLHMDHLSSDLTLKEGWIDQMSTGQGTSKYRDKWLKANVKLVSTTKFLCKKTREEKNEQN